MLVDGYFAGTVVTIVIKIMLLVVRCLCVGVSRGKARDDGEVGWKKGGGGGGLKRERKGEREDRDRDRGTQRDRELVSRPALLTEKKKKKNTH